MNAAPWSWLISSSMETALNVDEGGDESVSTGQTNELIQQQDVNEELSASAAGTENGAGGRGEISAWETFDSTRDSVFKSAADEDSRQARTESEELEASEAAERRLQEWLRSGTPHRDLSESPFQALAEWLQFRWRSLAGSEAVCLTASSSCKKLRHN